MLMPRGHLSFKQSDVVRALRAAQAAGITVEQLSVEKDGRIVLQLSKGNGAVTDGKSDQKKEIVL